MKKNRYYFLIIFLGIITALPAKAVCPVCTVAVGAGLGLSRYFGIDDTVSGVWIGGLTVSMIVWTINWFNQKNFHFKGRIILTTITYYVLVVIPLYFMKDVWHPFNVIWGINKLLLGIILGSIFFFGGSFYYEYLKKQNNNHAYFPYQKVVMPVSSLIILSLVFYFITK